ncbi:UNVERIFIED_CONTAM: hypothetical protein BEN50_18895, partial [Euhalothece sp. KZN 001]
MDVHIKSAPATAHHKWPPNVRPHMDDPAGAARDALGRASTAVPTEAGSFSLEVTVFTISVEPSSVDGQPAFDLRVLVPPLGMVTEEPIPSVVEDEWFRTFELRLADIAGATRGHRSLAVDTERGPAMIAVDITVADQNLDRALADITAVAEYIEGTYVEGLI